MNWVGQTMNWVGQTMNWVGQCPADPSVAPPLGLGLYKFYHRIIIR